MRRPRYACAYSEPPYSTTRGRIAPGRESEPLQKGPAPAVRFDHDGQQGLESAIPRLRDGMRQQPGTHAPAMPVFVHVASELGGATQSRPPVPIGAQGRVPHHRAVLLGDEDRMPGGLVFFKPRAPGFDGERFGIARPQPLRDRLVVDGDHRGKVLQRRIADIHPSSSFARLTGLESILPRCPMIGGSKFRITRANHVEVSADRHPHPWGPLSPQCRDNPDIGE